MDFEQARPKRQGGHNKGQTKYTDAMERLAAALRVQELPARAARQAAGCDKRAFDRLIFEMTFLFPIYQIGKGQSVRYGMLAPKKNKETVK